MHGPAHPVSVVPSLVGLVLNIAKLIIMAIVVTLVLLYHAARWMTRLVRGED